jgi:hypothetical protein
MWEEVEKTKKKKDTTMAMTMKEKGSGDDDDDIDDDYGGVTVVRMIFDRNCAPPTTKVTKSGVVTVANVRHLRVKLRQSIRQSQRAKYIKLVFNVAPLAVICVCQIVVKNLNQMHNHLIMLPPPPKKLSSPS